MKRFFILFNLTLFLLISCGIPYIYIVENSDIKISSTTPDTTVNPLISKTIITINQDELLLLDQKGNSPEINFVYLIEPVDNAKNYSSLVSSFSKYFSSQTNGYTFNRSYQGPVYTNEVDKLTYGLYCLKQNHDELFDVRSINSNEWIFEFSFDQTTGELNVIVNDQVDKPVKLQRFNGSDFISSSDYPFYGNEVNDALADGNTSGHFNIKIYAFVSFNFGGKYTNTANTSISYSNPILKFTI